MPSFTDQIGNTITLDRTPRRIVSLVPSQTELLFDLGLDEEVVGITKFCIHPSTWFRSKTRVGGTKQLHLEIIRELQPDLIIANKEENVREQVEALSQKFPVWTSDVNTLEQALEMIRSIGELTGPINLAVSLVHKIEEEFSKLRNAISSDPAPLAAYLIWRDPLMAAGGDNFINEMMLKAGLKNVFEHRPRYPSINIEDLRQSGCQLLLLSSEPYPFAQKHIYEMQPLLPGVRIMLVDGEMFSWYGSRLVLAPLYFVQLQNEILSLTDGARKR